MSVKCCSQGFYVAACLCVHPNKVVGIYTCYLYYGVLQEDIYRPDEDGRKFESTLFLLFAQCVVNFIGACCGTFEICLCPVSVALILCICFVRMCTTPLPLPLSICSGYVLFGDGPKSKPLSAVAVRYAFVSTIASSFAF